MTQITYETNGPGLPEYPSDLPVANVNVYLHDSSMAATHDYPCPVCRENHAVLDLSCGVMEPCWSCQKEGWQISKKKTWKEKVNEFLEIFG